MPRMSVYVPDDQLDRVRKRFGDPNMSALTQLGLALVEALSSGGGGPVSSVLQELNTLNRVREDVERFTHEQHRRRRRRQPADR